MNYYKITDEINKPVVSQPLSVAANKEGFCCSQCHMYELNTRSGEGFFDCFFGSILPLRTKIRTERGIEGSICGDVCAILWYPCCSLFQMGMKLKTTNLLV